MKKTYSRESFLKTTGAAVGAGFLAANPILSFAANRTGNEKMRLALVGTGVRGVSMYGRRLIENYGEYVDMVGICDKNPGRLAYGADYIQAPDARTYTDLDEMLTETKPDWLIITTWDWEHHKQILTGLKHGCNIICEKPITIDEEKAQIILDAEREYGKEIIVTFNYRWPPHRARLKELLMSGEIGEITSVDFHWNLDHDHLKRYMQRWHGERDRGGTLWVHKATHHFDMINWFLNSEPEMVFAQGALEQFGHNGPFRGDNCRNCAYTQECPYYWDITANDHLRQLYTDNEEYDGYIRDNCVFRPQINIYDKHSAMVRYANGVHLNYSLAGQSDHSGYWLAFNGTKGRIEGQEGGWPSKDYQDWKLFVRDREPEVIRAEFEEGGHWGGDPLMNDKLFRDPDMADPLNQAANARDGVMSILTGIAARNSCESGQPVYIRDLTSLRPRAQANPDG
ncbi:MAG: Gfo/Idh/MocA family protein [Bacteroidota bacterium]